MKIWIFAVVICVCDFAATQAQDRFIRDATSDLFYAIETGNDDEVFRAIENGANINANDNIGQLAIHRAAFNGRLKIVDVLLRNGADVNSKTAGGWSPLHLASLNRHVEVVEFLGYSGADMNIKTNLGSTALHVSSLKGHVEVAKILLRNGADVNSKTNTGATPLHLASLNGFVEVVKVLIKYGADVSGKDNDGSSPLNLALLNNHLEVVEFLLASGADANSKTNFPSKPPQTVFFKGPGDELKAAPNDPKQLTELQRACDKYSSEEVFYLINNGTKAENGEFPWMAALLYVNDIDVRFSCSGTIISERFIMTAAHCIDEDENKRPAFVRLGVSHLGDRSGENYHIKEIIRHKQFSLKLKKNDIALLRLSKEIVFNPNIRPACLETGLQDLSSELRLNITGWGSTSAEGNGPSIELRKAEVVTMPLHQCSEKYRIYNEKAELPELTHGINMTQYCAYDPNGRTDVARGDSGGPLQIVRNPFTPHVVGIASFGIASGTLPTVYTRVAHYAEWIAEHVWPDSTKNVTTCVADQK